ncbi:uncharacterized protein LOC117000414 isoform X2 [Catharus ustulatus]|uniref:uncharacterized protein LOC117000414 isoform X2 n=2 Tax=Catharus ustulatus TaxID=91951 RepID=UPI00140D7BFF|nr:uncharacterized protein LOC117000414 isoform X2 [Catharus ustulatus]
MKFSKFGIRGKFFNESKGTRRGMVSLARESKAPGEGRSSTSMKRVAGWDPICEAAQSPRSRLEKKQHFGTRGTRRGPSGVRHPLWLGYKQIPTESQGAPMKHKISIQISSQPGMVQTWLGTPGSGWLALQAYGEEHCSFLGISQAYSCQQPPGAHRIGLEKISDHRVKLNISVSTRLWHSVPCPDPSLNTSRNSDSTALTARHTLPVCTYSHELGKPSPVLLLFPCSMFLIMSAAFIATKSFLCLLRQRKKLIKLNDNLDTYLKLH